MRPGVSVVIPTHPPRASKLRRALASVCAQTVQPIAVVVENDVDRTGSAATRNRGLAHVTTEWVAFLDSDDQLLPHHLERLTMEALKTGADVVYPLPRVIGPDGQIVPRHHDWGGGPEFDPEYLRTNSHIPVNSLVRTERRPGRRVRLPPRLHRCRERRPRLLPAAPGGRRTLRARPRGDVPSFETEAGAIAHSEPFRAREGRAPRTVASRAPHRRRQR
ncbi:glycosyltransferase [Streptomyces sp. NBC_01390]|uniref:glycosyltransferase family 2 protein n=1 Tax=Streptomyces sp. NBC_01390 TaxID=2903850 RepID=UPI00324C42BF